MTPQTEDWFNLRVTGPASQIVEVRTPVLERGGDKTKTLLRLNENRSWVDTRTWGLDQKRRKRITDEEFWMFGLLSWSKTQSSSFVHQMPSLWMEKNVVGQGRENCTEVKKLKSSAVVITRTPDLFQSPISHVKHEEGREREALLKAFKSHTGPVKIPFPGRI